MVFNSKLNKFRETLDTSCLKFKIFQPVRVCDAFTSFPKYHWTRGRYLGAEEDTGDEMTFIVEVVQDGEKSRLTRSVVQEVYSVAAYPPKV